MLNDSNLKQLKIYLKSLGYSEQDIVEIISAYTALIPVLGSISFRKFKEKSK